MKITIIPSIQLPVFPERENLAETGLRRPRRKINVIPMVQLPEIPILAWTDFGGLMAVSELAGNGLLFCFLFGLVRVSDVLIAGWPDPAGMFS